MDVQQLMIGLDIGQTRVGVARTSWPLGVVQPWKTIAADDLIDQIQAWAADGSLRAVVVGMPRGLSGQDTAQTVYVRDCVEKLRAVLSIPVYVRDEAVTSIRAEEELRARGKPYAKADIDALSAVYILEDYLTHPDEAD